jgi:hypothetical protein
VKTGNSYYDSTFTKNQVIDQLNKKSHNQVFRKWINTNLYSDTLDLTGLYQTNPEKFIADSMPNLFKRYYFLHKGINISSTNTNLTVSDTGYRKFMFLTNFTCFDNASHLNGITNSSGGGYLAIFSKTFALIGTTSHEIGHSTWLEHVFPELDGSPGGPLVLKKRYYVPKFTSSNIMDYSTPNSTIIRNHFWYAQLIDVN